MKSFGRLCTDERGAAPLDRVVIIAGTALVLVLGAQEFVAFGIDVLVGVVESDTIAYSRDIGAVEDVALTQ